jgi:hypothetical protein
MLLFVPMVGAGTLAGVYACIVAYRSKMERAQPAVQTDGHAPRQ